MKVLNKIGRLFLAALLAVVVGLPFFPGQAFAVSDTFKGWDTGKSLITGGTASSSFKYRTVPEDKVAYCLTPHAADPDGRFYNEVIDVDHIDNRIKWILLNGYPAVRNIGGITLSDDAAEAATAMALYDLLGESLSSKHANNAYGQEASDAYAAAQYLVDNSGGSLPGAVTLNNPASTQITNFNASYRRVGPYTVTSGGYGTPAVTATLNGIPGSYVGNISGTQIAARVNVPFYVYLPVSKMATATSVVLNVRANYSTPAWLCYEGTGGYQDMGYLGDPISANDAKTTKISWANVSGQKVSNDSTQTPLADTEFKLEKQNGSSWSQVENTLTTDNNGKVIWPALTSGTYKMTEIRSNPNYATSEESGQNASHTFNVTAGVATPTQVFKNSEIATSCEVEKKTIAVTSAAYVSLPGEEGVDNTEKGSKEQYRYDIDFRSTSNFRADEFVVDDPLEAVSAGQIRVNELWTPITYGDTDGLFNVWYKTNKTDDSEDYSGVSALATNPLNANNPDKEAMWPNTGWKLGAQDVSTSERRHITKEELGLDPDEYITALRLEYGSVNVGFTSKNTEAWIPTPADRFFTPDGRDAADLQPLTYMVSCPNSLTTTSVITSEETTLNAQGQEVVISTSSEETETVISSSVDVRIARNLALEDADHDAVETRVIDTFTLSAEHPIPTSYVASSFTPVEPIVSQSAKTSDTSRLPLLLTLSTVSLALLGTLGFYRTKRRRVVHEAAEGDL